LTKAYLVLSDPARREKYDRTGQVDEKAVDNTLSQAVSAVIGVVMGAVEQHAAGGADPCSVDLVEVVRNMLKKQVAAYEDQKRKIEKVAVTLEAVEKRWKTKKKAELLKAALQAQIRATDEPLRKTLEMIEINKLALELLANSTFDVMAEKIGEGPPGRYVGQYGTWNVGPYGTWKSIYSPT
jgi:curved DNA-binding protein CbpA